MVSFGNLPNGFEASLRGFGSAKVAGSQGFCKLSAEIPVLAVCGIGWVVPLSRLADGVEQAVPPDFVEEVGVWVDG